MLPQENRLKNKKDFDRVFKRGKGFKEGPLFLKIAENNFKNSRFGFIVGKKVSKKATVRNKIKRQLRELIRLRLKDIKKSVDGVLVVSPDLKSGDFRDLEKTIDQIFVRTGLLGPRI